MAVAVPPGPRSSPGLNWSGVGRSGTLSARPSCRGPQIQSNSAWALLSSRRRPSRTKRSMGLLGGGASKASIVWRSQLICCSPLTRSHWPSPITEPFSAGRVDDGPGVRRTTRPPPNKVFTLSVSSPRLLSCSSPAAGRLSRASSELAKPSGSSSRIGVEGQRSLWAWTSRSMADRLNTVSIDQISRDGAPSKAWACSTTVHSGWDRVSSSASDSARRAGA